MSTITIVPCPHCGEDRFNFIVTRRRDNRFFIDHYDNVFHLQSSVGFDREEDAIAAWNSLFGKPVKVESFIDVFQRLYPYVAVTVRSDGKKYITGCRAKWLDEECQIPEEQRTLEICIECWNEPYTKKPPACWHTQTATDENHL